MTTEETSLSLAEDLVREQLPSTDAHAVVCGLETCDCVPIRVTHQGRLWELVMTRRDSWGAVLANYRRK